MMNVAELADAMRALLGDEADALARGAGFVRRERELTGSRFAQALVFGWLSKPDPSLSELGGAATTAGALVTPQAIHKRFTPQAAAFLRALLDRAVACVFESNPVAIPLLARFTSAFVQDGSVIGLPKELAEVWGGCGGSAGPTSALKLAVRLDLVRGGLSLFLVPGRSHDKATPVQGMPLPEGALRLADLGFFDLVVLGEIHAARAYFVSRLQAGVVVYERSGRRTSVSALLGAEEGDLVDIPILLGTDRRLPVRLIAERVPEGVAVERRAKLEADAERRGQAASVTRLGWVGWTIYTTNAPPELLDAREVLVLARARWQIEQLFRLWKSECGVDESVSRKPYRVLCEVYAKLITVVVRHWLFLVGCWEYPDRSMVKAVRIVRGHAMALASALASADTGALAQALGVAARALGGARMSRRRKRPNTYQLLLDPALGALS